MAFTYRLLQEADAPALDYFLAPHTPWAYFMRSNIRRGGVDYQGQEYQADYFGIWCDDELCGLLAHSWIGSVQCFLPQTEVVAPLIALWSTQLMRVPRSIECLLGPAAHVTALKQACGWRAEDFRPHSENEQLFTLELTGMLKPRLLDLGDVIVRRAEHIDASTLSQWRFDFNIEAIGAEPSTALQEKSAAEVARRIAERELYVLTHRGVLKSFCGAGGFLPDWKIIGPVWTPPDERDKGYGRAVTAGALALLIQEGASHAVLFAGNPRAKRTYESIGFTARGDWKLSFFKQPVIQLPLTA